MLDLSVPYYTVLMICPEPAAYSAPLPAGCSFGFYRPGMEEDWSRIQCAARGSLDPDAARKIFAEEFAPRPELLPRRMIFVRDAANRPVATGCLWPGGELGRPMERVCQVAVAPESQERGLGKAVAAKLLELYRAEGCAGGLYLTTQTSAYPAIGIYKKLGFVPYRGPAPQNFRTQGGSYAEETETAWEIIEGKLSQYAALGAPVGGKNAVGAEPPVGPAPYAVFFHHETEFHKCSLCKVFERSAPDQSGDLPHIHDYSQIWYVTRGSCEHIVENQRYEMLVGDAFLLPPKVTHCTRLREGGRIICCEFFLEELFPDQSSSYGRIREITQGIAFTMLFGQKLHRSQPKFTLSRQAQRVVERLMTSMLAEYNRGEEFYEDFLHLQILELLLTFAREYKKFPECEESEKVFDKYRSMVEIAIRYIDEHYDEALTLDGVCKISLVSKTYFCYLFKMLTGQTFVEYVMNLRINKAMELLRQTDSPVIDISQTVGFHDSTHFSRTFKRLKGISPRDYRLGAKRK